MRATPPAALFPVHDLCFKARVLCRECQGQLSAFCDAHAWTRRTLRRLREEDGFLAPFSAVRTYSADFLLVAAGGGGGGSGGGTRGGGGGGAGEYVAGTGILVLPNTSLIITIGAKGLGGVATANGSSAADATVVASWLSKTARGGGRGSNCFVGAGNGVAGGSGGGAGDQAVARTGGASTASDGTGHAGGDVPGTGGGGSGASGGGATAAGAVGVAGAKAPGGAGTANSISGISVTYCKGGDGGATNESTNGLAGVNPGDGGSGSNNNGGPDNNGGDGAVGTFVLSYLGGQRGTGGVITTAGGHTIHTFTTSGTFVA